RAGEEAGIATHPVEGGETLAQRACNLRITLAPREGQLGFGAHQARRRESDLPAAPVEERQRQRDPDERQQPRLARIGRLDAELERRRLENPAALETQRGLCPLQ